MAPACVGFRETVGSRTAKDLDSSEWWLFFLLDWYCLYCFLEVSGVARLFPICFFLWSVHNIVEFAIDRGRGVS